uniref:C2H2-type domain-containing protein n=1 Tax=viral metagenome TaxID=1070528 RepID=A0A6C0KFK2_9ZZZZ
MDCDFCKKSFSTKGSLAIHQKTAKFCLKLQGKHEESCFKCENCTKIFTQKTSLSDHIPICKERYKKLLDKKDEEHSTTIKRLELEIVKMKRSEKEKLKEKNDYIAKLESKLEKLEAKLEAKLEKLETAVTTIALESKVTSKSLTTVPTTTTTNNTTNITVTTNNVLNLSQEHVKKVLTEQLDYNVVYAGQAGLAKFVVDKMLKNQAGKLIYRCVDPSRQMFEFVDEHGETVRDMKAEKLIQSLLEGEVIKIGLDEAAKGWNTEDNRLNTERTNVFGPKVSEYAELNRNNTVFRSKVSSLTT